MSFQIQRVVFGQNMALQCALDSGAVGAQVALEGPLAGVGANVPLQVRLAKEETSANFTRFACRWSKNAGRGWDQR